MQTDQNPKVNVIIPCFNREKYIAATVNSVLAQTWQNVELIVVDDGCKDGSRAILDSYGSKLKVLEHPGRINRGQSVAINLGLISSNAPYVAILDSDDLINPQKLELQLRYLEAHPNVGLVYANGIFINEIGKENHPIYRKDHQAPVDADQLLLDCCIASPSATMIRRSVLDKIGLFNETLRAAQDHDIFIRIAEVSDVAYLPEKLWSYRLHADSISNTNAMRRWKNGFTILKDAVFRYPYKFRTKSSRFAVLCFRLGQCYKQQHNYIASLVYFCVAGISDPLRALKVVFRKERISSPNC